MVDQEHLDILRQGVEVWNKWRKEHPDIEPNFWSANFSDADFRRANFRNAIFKDADLSRADLSEADLMDAYLDGVTAAKARFIDARLYRAHLVGAYLVNADLEHADLRETELAGANFINANLERADLSEANLNSADLMDANLTGASLLKARLPSTELSMAKLDGAHLIGADLMDANLLGTHLAGAILQYADLPGADLSEADLSGANLSQANLMNARLWSATLINAKLEQAILCYADLSGADLTQADLSRANLVGTKFNRAVLNNCNIYGVSAWDVQLAGATQSNLVITDPFSAEPQISVDDLEVAQFIYLLLNHKKLRNVLNAVTERGVLILGRFGGGGLEVLQAIADKLREEKYLPIIFDFERPQDRDYTETVKTLVGLARFVIVDLSGPSVPQELSHTVPFFDIPFVPILEKGHRSYSMFADLFKYPWVLRPVVEFATMEELLARIPTEVIAPAEEKHQARQKLLDELFNKS